MIERKVGQLWQAAFGGSDTFAGYGTDVFLILEIPTATKMKVLIGGGVFEWEVGDDCNGDILLQDVTDK